MNKDYNFLHSIIEGTTDAIFSKDLQGRYAMINSAGARFIGKPVEEIIGTGDMELFSPDTAQKIIELDLDIMATGKTETFEEIATSNGITRTYLVTKFPYRNHKEDIIGVIGIARDITERKKVEEELKKIFDLSIDMICIAGIDGYFKKINPSFGKTLGYSNEELLGQPFVNFVHPDDKTKTLDVVENELSNGTDVINFENRYRCKNGSYRWFMWTAKPVTNEGIMFGIARDITKLKHDEEELKKHRDHLKALVAERTLELAKVNEKLRLEIVERKNIEKEIRQAKDYSESLINNSIDMIISVNTNRKIVIFNPSAEKTFGYKKEEVLGKHVQILYADPSQSLQVHKTTMNTSEFDGEVLNRKKDGSTFISHLSSTVLRDEKGVIIGFMGISRNITERKRVENALRQSKEQLQSILDNTTAVIYLKDPHGKYILINRQYQDLFHITKEDIMGKTDYDIFSKEMADAFQANDRKVLEAQAPLEMEEVALHDDGPHTYISIKFPLFNSNGIPYGVCGISTDITEREKAKEILQEQKKTLEQKNIALNEILGQIEIEKKQIKDNVIANAENLLLPIIQKLRLKGESRKYIQLLRENLQELTSSFGTRLTEKEAKLTSREIEICNMVKNGLANKEIANLLNISLGTTERHRNNIRKKLNIVNKDINLSSYLNTL